MNNCGWCGKEINNSNTCSVKCLKELESFLKEVIKETSEELVRECLILEDRATNRTAKALAKRIEGIRQRLIRLEE